MTFKLKEKVKLKKLYILVVGQALSQVDVHPLGVGVDAEVGVCLVPGNISHANECLCVCVCVCVRERERQKTERKRRRKRKNERKTEIEKERKKERKKEEKGER